MPSNISSSEVLTVIKEALINLGETRTDNKFGERKSDTRLNELVVNRGFVDEPNENLKFFDFSLQTFKKESRFVVTTCEALESFFIPCLDIQEMSIDMFLENIFGLADCMLDDINFVVDNSLSEEVTPVLSIRGEPYGRFEKATGKRGSSRYWQIPNLDAASFIFSSCLMAKNFLETLLNYSQSKGKFDLQRMRGNLNLILNKGMEMLLENHRKCKSKGWPLDLISSKPSIFGTWTVLEFINDIYGYEGNPVMMDGLNQNLITQLDRARNNSLEWMRNEEKSVVEEDFNIIDKDKIQYRLIIDELQGMEGEKDYEDKLNKAVVKALGAGGTEHLKGEFFKIYDKTQLLFSLLLSGERRIEFINRCLKQIINFYIDDNIYKSFIDRRVPLEKEYSISGMDENGKIIQGTFPNYGIVFEVFRMILKYVEIFPATEFSAEIKALRLEDKLDFIYKRDIISDRCEDEEYKYLWSQPHFELNYTENAIEALSFYYNYLKVREVVDESIELPAITRVPISKLAEELSKHLGESKAVSDAEIAEAIERFIQSDKFKMRDIMEFWRSKRKDMEALVEFWRSKEESIRKLLDHFEKADEL